VADRVRPDLLLVFDEGGVTGHLDHGRATEAALEFARETRLPVLAWAVAQSVAITLNEELGTTFVGRTSEDLDFEVHVDRGRQRRAIICHASQASDNPVLLRRLEVQGDSEVFRWLVAPSEGCPIGARNGLSPLSGQDNDQEG
jgi:LmbE family N-acetylglucosaminyl deacetylase